MLTRHRDLLIVSGLCALVALGLPALAEEDGCEGDPKFAQVSIGFDRGEDGKVTGISAPGNVTIYKPAAEGQPGEVCWIVADLKGGESLQIAHKGADEGGEDEDRLPGGSQTISSDVKRGATGAPSGTGNWTYGLTLEQRGDNVTLDPVIIIKGGGGGSP